MASAAILCYLVAMRSRVKLYFDGGCRPNPGAMEIAVVLRGHAYIKRGLGHGTSMDAEWLALIAAQRLAQDRALSAYILLGDSVAVVGQAKGIVKCPAALAHHFAAFQALVTGGMMPRIRHISRAQNLAGIALARFHPR